MWLLYCFNPCFNGFTTLTYKKGNVPQGADVSFNPCFNGFTTLTLKYCIPGEEFLKEFQSLF